MMIVNSVLYGQVATSICLGPILVYCITGFPGLPDDPAVLQPRVMPKQQVVPSPG